jgi:threonine dehydratase
VSGEICPELVQAAAARLAAVVFRTPLLESARLSSSVGAPVLLKREDLQVCRSYKLRGAYNLISSLSDAERGRGVVTASAGNHAQGVAFSCRQLGVKGRIFLPTNTPRQKRDRIADIGGKWITQILSGRSYDEASADALADSVMTGAVYVHPFDDPLTIAGQGTVALEIVEQTGGNLRAIIAPVGGGGLLAGIAVWIKTQWPEVLVIGAEPAGAASMSAALAHGSPITVPDMDTFIDGAAVARVGTNTFPIVAELVDQVISVPEGAVCTEMLALYQTEGIIAEPAGALASAAARMLAGKLGEGPVACVVSGGNNDVSRYAEVVERSMLHEGLRHYFLVTFPQEPGALRYFLDEVLSNGEDIVVFEYVKKSNRETGPALVGIDLQQPSDIAALLGRMAASPMQIERIPPGSPLFTFLL